MNTVEYINWTEKLWNSTPISNVKEDMLHASMGLVTEAAEIMDLIKKNNYYGKSFDRAKVVDEAGDAIYYTARLLASVGATFEEAIEANVAKLTARFGDKFNADKAINRNKDAEAKAQKRVFGEDLQD